MSEKPSNDLWGADVGFPPPIFLRFLLSSLIVFAGLSVRGEEKETAADRFAKFPVIGKFRPGERSAKLITSDGIQNVVRPRWTRAMGDLGGWPVLYRFKEKIFLQYPHVDAHRGARFEGTGKPVEYVSLDEGKSWVEPEQPLPEAQEVLVAENTVFYYRHMKGKGTQVCTSTDGTTFSDWKDVYKAPFWLWGVTYDPVSKIFWAPPHAIPVRPEQGTRQIHLLQSKDGIAWEYVSTVHANQDESESILRFEKDGTMAVLIRQKWGPRASWVAVAKPPYMEWEIKPRPQTIGGHHFYEIGGQTFVASRAVYRGNDSDIQANAKPFGDMAYYSAIYQFTSDHQLVPWAVMDSLGDCSYPHLVETPDEVLCAYYSQHEDKVCKVFLCGYDKKEFLAGPKQ
ncbi:MAG: hypothetical protein HY360_18235 [Verrucomicrobia bacterium]|nr:hypothetical protein [Verrucomicrobiota bacterium]